MKTKPRKAGRPRVAPEGAESFLLRVPPLLLAELRAHAELRADPERRSDRSVNTIIWTILREWAASQPRSARALAEKRAKEILGERDQWRAERGR